MNKTKIISLILSSVLIASTGSGCGNQKANQNSAVNKNKQEVSVTEKKQNISQNEKNIVETSMQTEKESNIDFNKTEEEYEKIVRTTTVKEGPNKWFKGSWETSSEEIKKTEEGNALINVIFTQSNDQND